MRRKRMSQATAGTGIPIHLEEPQLQHDMSIISENISGFFGTVFNVASDGRHNLYSVSPGLDEIRANFWRQGSSVDIPGSFDEFSERISGRLLLTGKAIVFLVSSKSRSSTPLIMAWSISSRGFTVSPLTKKETKAWVKNHKPEFDLTIDAGAAFKTADGWTFQ